MIKEAEFWIVSSNGKDKVHGMWWHKETAGCKGVVQLCHGMNEHIERYRPFAKYLVGQGWVVFGHDHLGHGKSAGKERLGHMDVPALSHTLTRDIHSVTKKIKNEFPDLPIILFGHSMGSFLVRQAVMEWPYEYAGTIWMATGSQATIPLYAVDGSAKVLEWIKGESGHLPVTTWFCQQVYNRKFHPLHTPSDWISSDGQKVEVWRNDPLCQFQFDIESYRTLMDSVKYVQSPKHRKQIRPDLPILLISGMEDPVGHYGKDPKQIRKQLIRDGHTGTVQLVLFDKMRHQILDEQDNWKVYQTIGRWLKENAERTS